MTWVEALILGIVQGLTEFLPVSSSGHLELGSVLLNLQSSNNLLFSIIVHGATALSTIVVFRKEIGRLLVDSFFVAQWNESKSYLLKIVLSMIPVGLVGVFFEEKIELLFSGQVVLVASMLAFTGILLLISHYTKSKTGSVTYSKSIIIGLMQAIAIMPGISRSGATITTALFLGVERSKAARFSFLMVLPPILGATLLKAIKFIKEPALADGIAGFPLLIGFLAAFVSGVLACSWMIKLVRKGRLIYFAIYCLLIATLAFIFGV